jgi:hypothetical protein
MGPFLKFNGKMYSELKPLYRGKYANRYTMPKGLPALQKPIPIHNITSDTLTEEQTMLDSVRKHHPELTGKGISVVIIDSGIFEHQMLRRNIKLGYRLMETRVMLMIIMDMVRTWQELLLQKIRKFLA